MKWIDIKKEGNVAIMTMNYEDENHFDRPFVTDINEALDVMEADDGVRAVVVTGAVEKYWSTGLHLQFMGKLPLPELVEYILYFNNMLGRWSIYPKPVIAAINGHAFAGGAILAAHADFRYMRKDRGWVCIPEIDINIPFVPGMIEIFKNVLAPGPWREMALTGKRYTAPEAKALGFIDEVYEKDELLPKSVEMAAFLAAKNPTTFATIKRRMRAHIHKMIMEEDPKYIRGEKS